MRNARRRGDAPSTRAASSCGGHTTSPLPLMVFQHFLLVTMDWTASLVPEEKLGE